MFGIGGVFPGKIMTVPGMLKLDPRCLPSSLVSRGTPRPLSPGECLILLCTCTEAVPTLPIGNWVKLWQVRVKLWQVWVKLWQVRVKLWQVRVKLWQVRVKFWLHKSFERKQNRIKLPVISFPLFVSGLLLKLISWTNGLAIRVLTSSWRSE